MITLQGILGAVAAPIAAAFPERYLYIGRQPANFERPSFLLELVTTARRRLGVGVDETEVYLTLTIHEELDETRAGSQEAALSDQDAVMGLFRQGILRVPDSADAWGRALPIAAANGGQDGGEAFVELTVTLRDGVGYDPEEGLDRMETVYSRVTLAGKGGGEL